MITRATIVAAAFLLPGAALAQGGVGALNGWIESQLAASGSSLTAFGLLFLGGLAASLLPCVYPLYPVTVSIIQGRSSGAPGWWHPVIYYVGLVLTYVGFGVLAALTGGMLNQVMTYAATNLLIGVMFLILALSVVELWHIPLFQPRDVKAGQGAFGTMVLGISAGLLSSACVGPVVVGVLLGVVASAGEVSLSTVTSASSKMLFFGLGLGLPFLLLGVFGMKLPSSGKWMRYVQWLLATLIVWFAWLYLEKGLEILGFSEQQIGLTIAGSALILLALYQWQDAERLPTERVKKAMMGLATVVGVAMLLRGVVPLPTIVATGGGQLAAAPADGGLTEVKHHLTWHLDESAAYERAALQGKNVFIDFFGNWCTNCKEFEKLTGSDLALNAALDGAVLLKVYDTSPTFAKYRDDARFQELKVGLPFFVITDPLGNLLYKTTDYLKTDEMALFLEP
ncbi:MAG: cytochrome c biogenesis protein CcdA [Pseudomonadota bacterium]